MKKIIMLLLLSFNLLAYKGVLAKSYLLDTKENRQTRSIFENEAYIDVLEDFLKNNELTEDEKEYIKSEIRLGRERIEKNSMNSLENLTFNDSQDEKENYSNLFAGKDFEYKEEDSTYAFYRELLDENFALFQKHKKIPSQIRKFEGKGEILGSEVSNGLIALTFDDGPSKYTEKIIDTLDNNGVRGTFFVLKDRLDTKYVSSTKKAIDMGFDVGVHSNTHKDIRRIKDNDVLVSEISDVQGILFDKYGYKSKYFRAPYGTRTLEDVDIINDFYDHHILWNIDSVDWHRSFTKEIILERVKRLVYLYNGGIVLFHDINGKTPYILDELIGDLHRAGFEFTTVTDYIKTIDMKEEL